MDMDRYLAGIKEHPQILATKPRCSFFADHAKRDQEILKQLNQNSNPNQIYIVETTPRFQRLLNRISLFYLQHLRRKPKY